MRFCIEVILPWLYQIFRDKLLIRGLEISPPIALAPMVGLSHSVLRTLVQEEGGLGLLFTEMLAAGRLPHDNEHCSPLLIKSPGEYPLFYQLVTADEQAIGPAIEKLHAFGAQGVDLNLGCPAPMQRRQGAGSITSRESGTDEKGALQASFMHGPTGQCQDSSG